MEDDYRVTNKQKENFSRLGSLLLLQSSDEGRTVYISWSWIIRQAYSMMITRKIASIKYWVKERREAFVMAMKRNSTVWLAYGCLGCFQEETSPAQSDQAGGCSWVLMPERIYLSQASECLSLCERTGGFIQPTVLCWSLTIDTRPGPGP